MRYRNRAPELLWEFIVTFTGLSFPRRNWSPEQRLICLLLTATSRAARQGNIHRKEPDDKAIVLNVLSHKTNSCLMTFMLGVVVLNTLVCRECFMFSVLLSQVG